MFRIVPKEQDPNRALLLLLRLRFVQRERERRNQRERYMIKARRFMTVTIAG